MGEGHGVADGSDSQVETTSPFQNGGGAPGDGDVSGLCPTWDSQVAVLLPGGGGGGWNREVKASWAWC